MPKIVINSKPIQVDNYNQLLSMIREKPGLYFGTASITALQHFLNGFNFSEDFYEIPVVERLSGFDWIDFENYIHNKYNHKNLTVRSFYIARQISKDEYEAFFKWFDFYDEYLTSKG